MNKLFEIQTLSDRNYRRLKEGETGMDPLTVIAGISTILPSLFPNMFGSERLTMAHLNKLFPGNGHYTTLYKNYLLQRIKYLKDVERDLHMYTGQFIETNQNVFCTGGTGTCWQGFYKVLNEESYGGGLQPPPGIDYSKLLLYGGGALLLIVLLNKKKKGTKK